MKALYVTVASGMCNRLFVVAAALRLCRAYGHALAVFWTERTGRGAVPYVGTVCSGWTDYFQPLPGVAMYAVSGHPRFQDTPVALDRVALADGTAVRPRGGAEPPTTTELLELGRMQVEYLSAPRVVDPRSELIIVRGETYPFGTAADPMDRYMGYFVTPGPRRKDAFLRSLSSAAQRFVLRPELAAQVAAIGRTLAPYRETWGVHVRGTDMHRRTTVDRVRAVNELIADAPPDVGIFLASDEPLAWLERPERVVVYDNPLKYENSVAGTRHALVDLYALARCTKLYGSAGSSFSMMAWVLSALDEYTIHS